MQRKGGGKAKFDTNKSGYILINLTLYQKVFIGYGSKAY